MSATSNRDSIKSAVRARIAEQRERHRRRPIGVRVLSGTCGSLLSTAGFLLLWAPEFGLPLLVAGFGLLALEFDWAVRARAWTEWRVELLRDWVKRQPPATKVAFPLIILMIISVAAWWVITRTPSP